MDCGGAPDSIGQNARHAIAHLRRRGLEGLVCCSPEPGRDLLLARDPATGVLVIAHVSDGSAAAMSPPLRVDAVLVTFDETGALVRLEHREGIAQSASCW